MVNSKSIRKLYFYFPEIAHLSHMDFWISISLHAVTLFTILLEVVLNRMLVQIKMVLAVYGTVVMYMFLTFIIFGV
ncbi:hypothetical protein BY458DRAFT_496247 [Sporodiniella umbellata]|nr:hypothetical protein BY458DRAFT_496247 [Sporodiniella umbellata]